METAERRQISVLNWEQTDLCDKFGFQKKFPLPLFSQEFYNETVITLELP